MGKKDTGTVGLSRSPSGSHHYTSGPGTNIPHHTGAK
jgi:hypothetical protein